jgi:hypothetical protein
MAVTETRKTVAVFKPTCKQVELPCRELVYKSNRVDDGFIFVRGTIREESTVKALSKAAARPGSCRIDQHIEDPTAIFDPLGKAW